MRSGLSGQRCFELLKVGLEVGQNECGMKRGRIIVLCVAATIVVAVVGNYAFRPREPVYQGRQFSEWLDQYYESRVAQNRANQDQAESALRSIGTNALPPLLRMVAGKDSALKRKLLALLAKQSFVSLRIRDGDYYHSRASFGFAALGPIAKPAVPELILLLSDTDRGVQAAAANALAGIGPEAEDAVPSLLRCLDDRNNGILQIETMMALGSIHKKPEIVVPVLIEYLDGPRKEWNFMAFALPALGWYGEEAKAAIPTIKQYLDDPNGNIKSEANNALWRIDREAAAKTQVK